MSIFVPVTHWESWFTMADVAAEDARNGGHFFSTATNRFFKDKLSNYRIQKRQDGRCIFQRTKARHPASAGGWYELSRKTGKIDLLRFCPVDKSTRPSIAKLEHGVDAALQKLAKGVEWHLRAAYEAARLVYPYRVVTLNVGMGRIFLQVDGLCEGEEPEEIDAPAIKMANRVQEAHGWDALPVVFWTTKEESN